MRLCHQSAAAHHLHLAHDVAAGDGGLCHEHAHEACLHRLKLEVVVQGLAAGELRHGGPMAHLRCHVNAALHCLLYP